MCQINHIDIINQLELQSNEYVILGSAAIIANHIEIGRTNDDIDILTTRTTTYRLLVESKITHHKTIGSLITYTDVNKGVIDLSDMTNAFDSFNHAFSNSHLCGNYRFLNINGLLIFYSYLWKHFKKEKYKNTLEIISNLLKLN